MIEGYCTQYYQWNNDYEDKRIHAPSRWQLDELWVKEQEANPMPEGSTLPTLVVVVQHWVGWQMKSNSIWE